MVKSWMRRAVHVFLRYRLWVVVILLWGVMAAGFSIFAPSLSQSGVMDETSFLPSDSAALQAQAVLKEKFPDQVAEGQGLLVLSNPGGLTAADREYATQLGQWLISPAAPPQVKRVLSPLKNTELQAVMTSQDGQALLIEVDFSSSGYSAETNDAVEAIRAHVQENKPADLEVALTGSAAMGKDMMTATLDSTGQTTWVTIILVVVVLLLVYKSPIASLVPLITVALAALVARGLLGWIASGNMQLSSMLDALTVVLVFGAGTDYVLFLISRFREELSGPGGRSGAIIRTTQRMAPVLLASAGTVILGLLGMLVASFGMIRSNGPAMALSILIAVMAALTLTPSLLFLFGRKLFWPFHKRMEQQDGKRGLINWEWVGRLVTRKPAWVVGVVLLLLLAPYPAWLGMRTSFDLVGEIPPTMDSARGFALLEGHFPAGEMSPLTVILTSRDDDLRKPAALASLAVLTRKLEGISGVSAVRSALQPSADVQARAAFQVSEQLRATGASLLQFASPSNSSELAALAANGGASSQLAPLRTYLEELKAAFPSLAETASFQKAWEKLRGLSTAVDDLLSSARVDYQLAVMEERLQELRGSLQDPAVLLAGGNTGPAGLTELRVYLEELGNALPQVKTASGWSEGLVATVALEELAAALRSQAEVSSQLQVMAEGLEGAAVAAENPGALLDGSTGNPLQPVADYLQGLAAAFPDLAQDEHFQASLGMLGELQATIASLQEGMQVWRQLQGISQALAPLVASLADPAALGSTVASAGSDPAVILTPLGGYLAELAAAFPEVQEVPAFVDAGQRLVSVQQMWTQLLTAQQQMQQTAQAGLTLTPSQTQAAQAALSALSQELIALQEDLQSLQNFFTARPEAILLPTSLPLPEESQAALQGFGEGIVALSTQLCALADTIPEGTLYLPPGFAEQPEAQQAISQLQQAVSVLSSTLQSLQGSLAGQPLYFLPQRAGKEEAEAARAAVEGDLLILREGLTETASALAGEPAYLIPASFLQENPLLGQMVDHYFAPDGSATQLSVLLQDDPYSFSALETSERVKTVLAEELPSFAGATPGNLAAYVGGVAAMASDMRSTVDRDFLKVQIIVVVAVFLVLVLLLRSLVAPLYLALSVIVSYGTTMGLSALIFQHWLGFGGVNYALPILVFVLLVALGSDYNIFLMSRVREETARCGDLHEGIRRATVYTGSIITSCGLILAGTFAALAFSPIRMLMQIGLAVALGVLVDTFLVRSLLVPALAALLGRWNWWPSRK